jgi:hypothetical protein
MLAAVFSRAMCTGMNVEAHVSCHQQYLQECTFHVTNAIHWPPTLTDKLGMCSIQQDLAPFVNTLGSDGPYECRPQALNVMSPKPQQLSLCSLQINADLLFRYAICVPLSDHVCYMWIGLYLHAQDAALSHCGASQTGSSSMPCECLHAQYVLLRGCTP